MEVEPVALVPATALPSTTLSLFYITRWCIILKTGFDYEVDEDVLEVAEFFYYFSGLGMH